MKSRIRVLVGVLAAMVLMAVSSCATMYLSAHADEQQTSTQRTLRVDVNQNLFGGSLYVAGVCDTGNGAMVYVAYTSGLTTQPLISTTSVPNGCRKESER